MEKKIEFNGSGFEYFKIWIVNIFLTIITLGIYYPWAKVRNNLYFYGNTYVENRYFNYLATGKQLLLGYLVGLGIVFTYYFIDSLYPIEAKIGFSVVFAIFFPWLIWKSMSFNIKVTSFDNIRFDFYGELFDAYKIYLFLPVVFLVFLSIAISSIIFGSKTLSFLGFLFLFIISVFAFSYFEKKKYQYFINSISYVGDYLKAQFKLKEFILILLKTILFSLFLMFIFIVLISLISIVFFNFSTDSLINLSLLIHDEEFISSNIKLILPILFSLYAIGIFLNIFVFIYYKVRLRDYVYSKINYKGITLKSTMGFFRYSFIVFTNILLLIITLGIAYPWAKVRATRYVLNNTIIQNYDLIDVYLQENIKEDSALGEEIADALDFSSGINL